ncbi:hypothetical protein [Paraliomyxa miuraensis]|uniref:hypothetical protein n=1 Tax=Paraliomyxa miuraensis TaxID=376150 RepID=UPI002256B6B2|nr:hypothetical protein [Paraliomyxa miuraensis]MCX4244234.1 hypothetical protein [Paraliomyxa miuraensis]
MLSTVLLDRRAGVISHRELGVVEIVDHLTAWVFEDGTVLAAVNRRSAVHDDRVLKEYVVAPAQQVGLTAMERLDVLHVAGLRGVPAPEIGHVRWEVA